MRNILSPLCLCSFAVALPQSIVLTEKSDDTSGPWTSDPTSPPTNISFPSGIPPNPYPSGIPVLPDICDGEDPSDDCVNALASGSGGYLYFDKNSGCSDSQKGMIETAVWDATTLANYASPFPDTFQKAHGVGAGLFYMGPDFRDQQTRISGNFKRVAEFKTSRTSSKAYVTLSCKDPKNWCHKRMDDKSIGGYAWTVEGWLAWYHYIAFCPPFFTLDNLDEKLNFIEQELSSGNTKYASQLDWLSTTGSYFLHEMMHTRIATGGIEPAIEDQPLEVNFTRTSDAWVYGPKMVHRLASWKISNGGELRELHSMLIVMQCWLTVYGQYNASFLLFIGYYVDAKVYQVVGYHRVLSWFGKAEEGSATKRSRCCAIQQ